MSEAELRLLLDDEARRINSMSFIDSDPVQFPRRFRSLHDIEIVSLVVSSISWGNRQMICRNAERLLALMDYAPYSYVIEGEFERLPVRMNLHRTFFSDNLKHYLRGLRFIYGRYESIDAFAMASGVGKAEAPAFRLAELLNLAFAEANGGCVDARCLPQNLRTTPLKRLNMALRWLVRDDGIVDMGVWRSIRPSQLYIPLDVHVGDTARALGLLSRRSNDRRSLDEIMLKLRRFNPADPVIYDYALFGIGMGL